MSVKKLPDDFEYLKEMYDDGYFPNFLVDQLRDTIREAVTFIEEGNHSKTEIQEALDKMTLKTNELQEAFEENDSEIETVARDSIGMTVENILKYFGIDIDTEEAIREREW
jgi:methyl-accepting chemotaxis protein